MSGGGRQQWDRETGDEPETLAQVRTGSGSHGDGEKGADSESILEHSRQDFLMV